MSTWYYMKQQAQTGPVSTEELRSLFSGGLDPATLVWREGLPGWAAAHTLSELSLPPPAGSAGQSASPGDVEKNKVAALLSYLPPLLFLVPLLTARESRFAMYHCNQGLVLTLAAIALAVVETLLDLVLVFIPVVGWILMFLLHTGAFVGVIALAIIGLINASQGTCKPLPVIGRRFTLVK